MRRRSSPYHQRDLHCDIGRDHLAGAYMDLSRRPVVTEEESSGRAGIAVPGAPWARAGSQQPLALRSPVLLAGWQLAPDT